MRVNRHLLLFSLAAAPAAAPLVFPRQAHAGEVERAEAQRLREDMRSLAQRNAWEGVERAFEQLEDLLGDELAFDDLHLGAQAARALGDMTACRERLARAVAIKPDPQAVQWLEEIDTTYGEVHLKLERGGKAELQPDAMPFVPDQRKSIERARKALEETGRYDGLLPGGTYTLGPVPFQVTPGGNPVELSVRPRDVARVPEEGGGRGFAFGYVGPRVELGAVLSQGGDPSDPDVAPPAFGGPGVRLGAGVEVGLPMGFGAAVTVGYHGLRARVDRSDADQMEEVGGIFPGHLMRMGYLAPGVTWRWLNLWLGAGPVVGMGTAQVVNEDETDADHLVWNTDGPMLTAGVQGSLAYALFRVGPQLRGALGLQGGLLLDGERTYTWGQLALSLAPNGGR